MKIFLKGDITTSTKVKSLINRLGIEFKSKNDYLFEGNEIIGIEYSFLKSIITSGFGKIRSKMLVGV